MNKPKKVYIAPQTTFFEFISPMLNYLLIVKSRLPEANSTAIIRAKYRFFYDDSVDDLPLSLKLNQNRWLQEGYL